MEFTPKTEKEIAENKLSKKGVYDFEIVDAVEKASKSSGNQMIELKLKISEGNGTTRTITDYLVATRMEKLRHAAAACGLLDKYDSGALMDSEFRGKRGKLKLGIEKGKNGYADKNVVADYIVADNVKTSGSGFFSGNVRD